MDQNKSQRFAGWMMVGLTVTGTFGIIAALFAWLNEFDYIGVGICLLAAAYAFNGVLKAYR